MDSNITINIVEPGSVVPVPDTGLSTTGIDGATASILVTIAVVVIIAIATILHLRKKKISLKPSKRTSTILGLLAIITSIGTFTGLTLNSIYNNTNAEEGTLTVNVEDADLTIELGDEPVFAVLPVDVKVAESTPAGYTLTSYTETTGLVSTTDESKTIPMIAVDEDELSTLTDNTYGLSLTKPEDKDSKVYTTLSTGQDNPTLLAEKEEATEANDATTIYYGFYITPDTPYGTYKSSDIYYNATTNSSKVIFHGNGLYFNNNPEQTTNDVEYITSITDKTAKYSHTPNINDEGEASGIVGYHSGSDILNKVITIPGASKISIKLSYGGGYISGGYPAGFVSFWQGSHPDYTTGNNIDAAIKTCGTSDVTDGKFYGNRNNENAIITTECELEGNAVTFAYWAQGGGPSQGAIYGYYAVITGYDADGNIIYLPSNTQVGGEYKDPAQDLPYIFLGWNEDKEATTAVYESKNDIELDLPLAKGKTTELYAIWQHATKIHFDGNGSDGGEGLSDQIIAAGKSIWLSNTNPKNGRDAYTRNGYAFNGWNTAADGSGTNYYYTSFVAPIDKSQNLTLYAQWSPATTIVYDGNGGEGDQIRQAIRTGETSNIYGNWGYFNKDGYAFSHWNTKPDGTGTSYYQGDQFTAPDQSTTITLYAQWSPATTIVYDGNGGEGSGTTQTIRAGETSSIYGNWGYFNKDGYAFSHWNTKPDGSGETYYEGNQFTASDQSTVIALYAQWSPATTIIYDGNGGEGNGPTQTICAGETSNIYGNWGYFNKDGYGFSHWNTKPDGTGTSYYQGDQFTAPDQSTTITLYAQWLDTVTIVFDANGGDGYMSNQYIALGQTSSLYGNQYYKDGLFFAGWNTQPDGSGTSYSNYGEFTAPSQKETITLYAQWTDNAMLDTGQTVNTKLKRLAGNSSAEYYTEDTNITTITRASTLPTDFVPTNDNTISMDGSATPVYAWYDADTTTIYYYAESDGIIMNPDSISMFYNFTSLSDATSIADWDTSNVTNMGGMFGSAGYNATTFSLDLSSWDTSNVTNMGSMFFDAGYNATTWSIGDLSSWDTSKVTYMGAMFFRAGYNATTWSIGDLSSWNTSKVTDMGSMFSFAGYSATTFSLDLSSWDTSKVTDMQYKYMFYYAGSSATTWSVTIPQKTGDIDNTTSAFYGQNSSIYASPPNNRFFTLAAQANSNTTNTTGSLNSVNNAGSPNQDNSSGNRSVYATEDAGEIENTENDDSTSSDTTSTPSRQEPLGEHQSSAAVDDEGTNIIIPMLIAVSITLGVSVLVLLAYKSRRREDE